MPKSELVTSDYQTVYWYILFHSSPETIETHLREENRQRELLQQPPIEYIIPYLHLNKAETKKDDTPSSKDAALNNSLRNYLHYFVFIKASKMQLDILLRKSWNTGGLYHLHYRISHSGVPLRMRERDMVPLIKTLAEYQHKYSFREFDAATLPSGTVRIVKDGPFKGRTANVLKVLRQGNGFSLTLGVPIFQKEFFLELYDFNIQDVEVVGGHITKLFEPYFLEGVERELLTIFDRRIRRLETPAERQEVHIRLLSYDTFRYLTFEDPVLQTHFEALLLLVATLQGNASEKAALVQQLRSVLADPDHPASDEEAFLLSVLFIATRKGPYRKAIKDYLSIRGTTELSSLRSVLPILKRVNTR